MDRSVLEGDPHAVLEGMIIAGYAIGAEQGYVYCRAEYPLALKRLDIAIDAVPRERLTWARTSSAPTRTSTSRSRRARAPSSAAKRPR